jgi:prepilin-type N-terminal cleavage/methylation domain-containing protein
MTMRPIRQNGFSLIELMVAITAGIIVVGSVVVFAMASMKSNGDYVLSTRLTQELRNSLDLATRDLRRAGYDDDSLKFLGNANTSPFARLRVEDITEADATHSDCVLYAYDRTAAGGTKGVLDVDNGEVRGIRRKLATVNGKTIGVLEYAVSESGVKPACADTALDYSSVPVACVGTWCPLSDSRNLDIADFDITQDTRDLGTVGTGQMRIRNLLISMTGRLSGNSDFVRRVETRVKIQADCSLATFSNCNNLAP